jgi:beta-fructofuranosidase
MPLPANKEVVFDTSKGNSREIIAEIDVGRTRMIEMDVLRSPNKEEFTRILFFTRIGHRRQSTISIDSSFSSTLEGTIFRAPESAPVAIKGAQLRITEPLKLRVFIDRCVVEVFVNERQCVAVRVYPARKDSLGVSLRARQGDATLKSLNDWQMNSIYE